jgi:hypothetical protein
MSLSLQTACHPLEVARVNQPSLDRPRRVVGLALILRAMLSKKIHRLGRLLIGLPDLYGAVQFIHYFKDLEP